MTNNLNPWHVQAMGVAGDLAHLAKHFVQPSVPAPKAHAKHLQAMGRQLSLAAGMSVSAEIIQDKRTVFEYFFTGAESGE